ncbi:hypothetical protein RND71_019165 [Anisodus tanguticus]|uniref:Uncharacterized protein n=1 Tax=Anisodus tanguticus TaxID=243964 RepID=A0AAE1S014_9SOLA|nr:hypothetical protein RND71_019165 [Anisodus tanguticus]
MGLTCLDKSWRQTFRRRNTLKLGACNRKDNRMEVVVDSRIIADDVEVSMQSKKLTKSKTKVGDEDWTVVTRKECVGTVVDTLVHDNDQSFVTNQGVRSNSSENILCPNSFDALSVIEEQ